MSDLRREISRIGDKFEPPVDSFERVVARKQRQSRRRLFFVVGLVVLLGGSAAPFALAQLGPEEEPRVPQESDSRSVTHYQEPACPPRSGARGLRIVPSAAVPGAEVVVTGRTPMHGEGEVFLPIKDDDEMHFWWNASGDEWFNLLGDGVKPLVEPGGSVIYLGSEELDDAEPCFFEFRFEVPDVEPGVYPVTALKFGRNAAALFDDDAVRVIP